LLKKSTKEKDRAARFVDTSLSFMTIVPKAEPDPDNKTEAPKPAGDPPKREA
jgi:hypothetical protein